MPDSSNIDAAIVQVLGSDSTLLSYMTNGVYIDEAPPDAKRFVIVSLIDAADVPNFGGRAYEDALYLIKAVGLSTSSPNMKAAAARIDALLEDQTLNAAGYTTMVLHREARIRLTEVDELDPSIRWFHRGGHYRVQMTVNA